MTTFYCNYFSTAEQNVNAAKKNFTFYTGSCEDNEQEALARIRLNFLNAVQNSPLANYALCDVSQGQDCVVENVKVYCGQNSRKRSVGGQRVITFDFVIKDMKASSDPKEEAPKYVEIFILVTYINKVFLENFLNECFLNIRSYHVMLVLHAVQTTYKGQFPIK